MCDGYELGELESKLYDANREIDSLKNQIFYAEQEHENDRYEWERRESELQRRINELEYELDSTRSELRRSYY